MNLYLIDSSPKSSATASTSFENQNQSETLNSSDNTTFDNSMNNSTTQAQNVSESTSPERTSTPVPIAESTDQNHCDQDQRASTAEPESPVGEKSPSWEQQTNTNSNSADNDANDSEVIVNLFYKCREKKYTHSITRARTCTQNVSHSSYNLKSHLAGDETNFCFCFCFAFFSMK